MKKLIFALLITVSFAACKKDQGQCYHCTHGMSNGVPNPDTEFCGDVSTYKPKDAQGNDMQVFCTPK